MRPPQVFVGDVQEGMCRVPIHVSVVSPSWAQGSLMPEAAACCVLASAQLGVRLREENHPHRSPVGQLLGRALCSPDTGNQEDILKECLFPLGPQPH